MITMSALGGPEAVATRSCSSLVAPGALELSAGFNTAPVISSDYRTTLHMTTASLISAGQLIRISEERRQR